MDEDIRFRFPIGEEQILGINARYFPPLPQDIPLLAAEQIRMARVAVFITYCAELAAPGVIRQAQANLIQLHEGAEPFLSHSANMRNAPAVLQAAWEGVLPKGEAAEKARRDAEYCIERIPSMPPPDDRQR